MWMKPPKNCRKGGGRFGMLVAPWALEKISGFRLASHTSACRVTAQ